jgi:coenzyme F420-0:L-glutamate ligase / coenzyme F420-1:gamma-L-glutamate ligase
MTLTIVPVEGLPEIRPGDVLADIICDATTLHAGDVVVVTQKVVSKAEGRLVAVDPDDPLSHKHLVEEESVRVLRRRGDLVITETRHGFVCANAGVDHSNVPGDDVVCLLPLDPDASARRIRGGLGGRAAVLIADSFGRAWRLGQADVAIGCAGLAPLDDRRGTPDAGGRELIASVDAIADQAASAAALARDKAGREAVVVVRGLERYVTAEDGPGAAAIVRPLDEDLFG